MPQAFDRADEIFIRQAGTLDKAPEGDRFSSEQLVGDLAGRGLKARHFLNTDDLLAALLKDLHSGDTVLIMSNGGFDGLHQRLLDGLE